MCNSLFGPEVHRNNCKQTASSRLPDCEAQCEDASPKQETEERHAAVLEFAVLLKR